ncbi:MAG: hypothetical protein JNJ83_22825 [Verrucomicrobiaceae bacterium]|nr:hypothetical protein [Verrucomicrobiaceae bacterium]
MPFDPSLPQANTEIDAEQMRDQLNALNDDIQTRATNAALASAIENTSANTNAVTTLDMNPEANYDPNQLQMVIQKLNELILTARR